MMDPNAKQLQRKPRKGDRIGFGDFESRAHPDPELAAIGLRISYVLEPERATHVVDRCDGNLCWITRIAGGPRAQSLPFIFRFVGERHERHPSGRVYSANQLARIFDRDGAQIPHPAEHADLTIDDESDTEIAGDPA